MIQKFGKHDQGPICLHILKWHSLVQQQIYKEVLHGLNSPVENKPIQNKAWLDKAANEYTIIKNQKDHGRDLIYGACVPTGAER